MLVRRVRTVVVLLHEKVGDEAVVEPADARFRHEILEMRARGDDTLAGLRVKERKDPELVVRQHERAGVRDRHGVLSVDVTAQLHSPGPIGRGEKLAVGTPGSSRSPRRRASVRIGVRSPM